MTYTAKGKAMIAAAAAHSDLNLFAAVAALMESSLVTSDCHGAEAKIAKICKKEQQKCLRRYDAAIKRAGGGTYGR